MGSIPCSDHLGGEATKDVVDESVNGGRCQHSVVHGLGKRRAIPKGVAKLFGLLYYACGDRAWGERAAVNCHQHYDDVPILGIVG